MSLQVVPVSSLEKVLPSASWTAAPLSSLDGFLMEELHFQIAYRRRDATRGCLVRFSVPDLPGIDVRFRQVRNVPVGLATYPDADKNYLTFSPGIMPDLLDEMPPSGVLALPDTWQAIWVDVCMQFSADEEITEIPIGIQSDAGDVQTLAVPMHILPIPLPEQKLLRTAWFHVDCLASYYQVPIYSEKHWEIIENFMAEAVSQGINTLLTPIHTPPLDTQVGQTRPNVQLVDIFLENGRYAFKTDRLRRWIRLAKETGFTHLEMAHLFTQWGAEHAPAIYVHIQNDLHRLFGWETDAAGMDYQIFLSAYIPAIRSVLAEEGMEENTFWHISDEPGAEEIESYRRAHATAAPYLQGAKIMDALSSPSFAKEGLVQLPVVSLDHLDDFLPMEPSHLWCYACCAQYKDVPNQFMAMPSSRNRILGVLLYLYHIEGYLHWGYNFYYSQLSDHMIEPYLVTDADGAFPSGDPFIVYPRYDGTPLASIRAMVMKEALQDLQALQALERLTGREAVEALIHEGLPYRLTMSHYPADPKWILDLRTRIHHVMQSGPC